MKAKKSLIFSLYIALIGLVIWQLKIDIEIITSSPTTASKKLVETNQLPIAFTFCKMFYLKSFDGNFSSQTHSSLKNISIFNKDSVHNLFMGGEMAYDFVSHIDQQMMCKEFDITDILKEKVDLFREYMGKDSKQNKNFHLYIHQPGMFYRNELGLKYPSRQFTVGEIYFNDFNPQANIQIQTYDLSLDPHIPCSTIIYQECITKEIILKFNASLGCTYPIQRYEQNAYCILFSTGNRIAK